MKKCAYCGCPNEDSTVACSECGVEFETSLSPDLEPQSIDPTLSPVIVARFSSLQQASLLVGRLEAAGIEASIPEEYSEQVFSGVVGLERVTVRVAAKDYQAAMAVMAEGTEVPSTDAPLRSSESQKETTEASQEETSSQEARTSCVSCGAVIPETAHLCPKCGWTQPDRAS